VPRPVVTKLSNAAPWRIAVATLAFTLLAVAAFAPSGIAEDAAGAKPEAQYAGADTCIACHDQVADLQAKDWHASRIVHKPDSKNCEECHGPSLAHTEDPGTVHTATNVTKARADKAGAACLRCHENQSRLRGWKLSDHARADVACWKCHSSGTSAHASTTRHPSKDVCYSCHREQAATFALTSHHPVSEGRLDCSDCHNPHSRGGTTRQTNDLCASCHREQAVPFMYGHGSMTGGLSEGCLDCHRAHGSPNGRLLKYAGRGLCLQCHADKALHFVGRTCWTSGCHAQMHGSNLHPLLLGQ
jgi:DmsE family decaheme c-type cytochrome